MMKVEGTGNFIISDLIKDVGSRAASHQTQANDKDTFKTPDRQKENMYQPEDLERAVSQLNDTMQAYSTGLRFAVHEKSGEIMVRVINERDGEVEVIREIPPEKVLDMVAYFKKVLGLMVDKLI